MSNPEKSATEHGCPFCREMRSGQIDPRYRAHTELHHRCVRPGSGVAILPSVAPLRRGHVLVLPVGHVTAAAHLDRWTREGLVDALATVAANICAGDSEPLIFEHGVGRGLSGGCGIEHAHVHLLPVSRDERLRAESNFAGAFEISEVSSLQEALELVPKDASYGVIGGRDSMHVAISEIPSQTLRCCAAEAIGSRSWDWRELGSWDVMEETFASLAA